MKLDYLATGSPDCPLIRLYDFTPAEVGQLLVIVGQLAVGASDRVEVHRLSFVEPVGGCRLTLICRSWDQAVVHRAGQVEFECGFTTGTWDNVVGLIESLASGAGGFQWLARQPGEAALLMSASGEW